MNIKTYYIRIICAIFLFVILFFAKNGSFAHSNNYYDVLGDKWYSNSVNWASMNGYVYGTKKNIFSPEAGVKRCDFIIMLARFDGVDKDKYKRFFGYTDVNEDSYYFEYVNWACQNGIASGTSTNCFTPEREISREEVCVILQNYINYKEKNVYAAKYVNDFLDSLQISDWAKNSVDYIHRTNIISGYCNYFNPKKSLKRAEAATVLYALDKALVKEVNENIIDIGNQRQILLDKSTVDFNSTSAEICYISPIKNECVFLFDKGYEYNNAAYHNIVLAPDGKYRMYYKATDVLGKRRICFIESCDGLNWRRPTGIYKYNNAESNIVTNDDYSPDNLFVFYDTNSNCIGTHWKGIYGQWGDGLFCEYSTDGLSFFCNGENKLLADPLSNGGMFFDTLNTMYYDEEKGKYIAFVRGLHEDNNYVMSPDQITTGSDNSVRDIRYIESKDFINWSNPIPLKYDDAGDWEMYANAIVPYYRAKRLYIGMPTRLINIGNGRYSTSVYLMASKDLINWDITENPYVKPEQGDAYEYPRGGFPCVGLIQTSNKEMSFYMAEADKNLKCQALYRYSLRIDGFCCVKSDNDAVFETKYIDYSGHSLEINYKTYRDGFIIITATDTNGKSVKSEVINGDTISKEIFTKGELSRLCPGAIKLTFDIKNAEIYSYKFN